MVSHIMAGTKSENDLFFVKYSPTYTMSNNSLPHIPSGIDSANIKTGTKSIVPDIQTRITKYLKSPNGYDPDNKLPKLRLTVIRQYLNNLVKFLREHTPSQKISQLNFILHSHIINGSACDFNERLYKVLYFLHELCDEDDATSNYVRTWDESVVYF